MTEILTIDWTTTVGFRFLYLQKSYTSHVCVSSNFIHMVQQNTKSD